MIAGLTPSSKNNKGFTRNIMRKNERSEGPDNSQSREQIKAALKQATIKELLDEAFRRGLSLEPLQGAAPSLSEIMTVDEVPSQHGSAEKRESLETGRRFPGERDGDGVNEAIAALRANSDAHHEYVGQLFGLMLRNRAEKMRALGVRRTNTTLEFANVGQILTKMIFDHLVVANRDALDTGAFASESLWESFMEDAGYRFASDMVKGNSGAPPKLAVSFIYSVIEAAALSFLEIVEEDDAIFGEFGNEP